MSPALEEINGAKVVFYSSIDQRHRPTGACKHTVRGIVQPRFDGLAICQYDGESAFYLFYCDASWNSITDTFHLTLEDAKQQAEFEYEGISATWQRAD